MLLTCLWPSVQRATLELCGSLPVCALCCVFWEEWAAPVLRSAPVIIMAGMTARDQGMPLSLLLSILTVLVKRTQANHPDFMKANYLLKIRGSLNSMRLGSVFLSWWPTALLFLLWATVHLSDASKDSLKFQKNFLPCKKYLLHSHAQNTLLWRSTFSMGWEGGSFVTESTREWDWVGAASLSM